MNTEGARSRARKGKMQMAPDQSPAKELKAEQQTALNSLVREQVIHALGEPANLLNVQVRLLWGVNYRVNVFVGANMTCASISNSFFVATDGTGNIVQSTPAIKRQY